MNMKRPAIDGYDIETLKEHYWCYKIWVKNIRNIPIEDKVLFEYQYIIVPTALTPLVKALQDQIPSNIEAMELEKLTKLATIFNAVAT